MVNGERKNTDVKVLRGWKAKNRKYIAVALHLPTDWRQSRMQIRLVDEFDAGSLIFSGRRDRGEA